MIRVRFVIALAVAVVALASACTSGAPEGTGGPEATATPTPTPTPAPKPSPTEEAEPEEEFTPQAADEVPKPIDDEHGTKAWGVYFVVTDYDDPELQEMVNTLEAMGYEPSTGDVGCDRGARAQLKVKNDRAARVALYFESKAAAEDFARRIEPRPIGIAHVQLVCRD